jgi:hypothetical protein
MSKVRAIERKKRIISQIAGKKKSVRGHTTPDRFKLNGSL